MEGLSNKGEKEKELLHINDSEVTGEGRRGRRREKGEGESMGVGG